MTSISFLLRLLRLTMVPVVALLTFGASTSVRADFGDYSGAVVFGRFDGANLTRVVSSPEHDCGKGAIRNQR